MHISLESKADIIEVEHIEKEITDQVSRAFAEKYEINDSLWFSPSLQGDAVVGLKPMVVNSAEYISKRFQNALERMGWTKEKVIDEQRIDAYREIEHTGWFLHLTKDEFLEVIRYLSVEDDNYPEQVSRIYKCFYKMDFPYFSGFFSDKLSNIGKPIWRTKALRVGLEFETGNIASSFRALSKLNYLFDKGMIDIGVFITSKNKNTSTRIWPSSNRNGSIEELQHRKYLSQINFPYLVFGFEPESYSRKAPYLAKTGEKYQIQLGNERLSFKGGEYIWDKDKGNKRLVKK